MSYKIIPAITICLTVGLVVFMWLTEWKELPDGRKYKEVTTCDSSHTITEPRTSYIYNGKFMVPIFTTETITICDKSHIDTIWKPQQ